MWPKLSFLDQQCNRGNKEFPDTHFDDCCNCIADMLEKNDFNPSLVDGLKDGDPFLDQQLKDIYISTQGR